MREQLQIIDAPRQYFVDPAIVAPGDVMKTHSNLQDAFVEIADRLVFLGAPDKLQRLMLVPILAVIELLERMSHLWRRVVATTRILFLHTSYSLLECQSALQLSFAVTGRFI